MSETDGGDGYAQTTPRGRVLDLFCGPGGTARGFQRLGYQVVGFDIEEQPKYPGKFHQRDLEDGLPSWVYDEDWAAVWASPSCKFRVGVEAFRSGENQIPLARQLVESVPAGMQVIENVPDAREFLRDPVAIDGGAFGLGVQKRRYFETNFVARSRLAPGADYDFALFDDEHPVEGFREAHGFPRDSDLTAKELRPAIPPAYVAYLHGQYEANGVAVQEAIA